MIHMKIQILLLKIMEIIASLANQTSTSSSTSENGVENRGKKKRKIKFRVLCILIFAILITSFFECVYILFSDMSFEEKEKMLSFFQFFKNTSFHVPCMDKEADILKDD